ncbi:MAG: extracellular solute-binding protein, partial [Solirubrobacterales bacterium]|nr:extracellular solute-binding protein [Solirubrobacterales bacterium]
VSPADPRPSTGRSSAATTAQDDRGARRAHRTRPQTAFLLVAGVSVAAVVALVYLLLSADAELPTTAGTTARLPPATLRRARLIGTVPAGRSPNDVVVTKDVVWVSSSQDPDLTRIPTAQPTTSSRVDVGIGVQSLATGFGTLWVAKGKTHSLLRLDLATGAKRGAGFALPDGLPVAVGTGQGGVWVGLRGRPGAVVRLNPRTGAVDRTVTLPRGVQDMAVGEGYVWVVNRQGRAVTRIDPDTLKTKRIPVGTAPKGIAVGEGFVWVCISSAGYVQQIDPRRARKQGSFRTGDTPVAVDVGGGSLWVSNRLGGSVTRISTDPARPRTTTTVGGLTNPFAIAARGGDVWVTDPGKPDVAHLGF